jgi:hypothetical protein
MELEKCLVLRSSLIIISLVNWPLMDNHHPLGV